MGQKIIDVCVLTAFHQFLQEQERSTATVEKYLRDVRSFAVFTEERLTIKSQVLK